MSNEKLRIFISWSKPLAMEIAEQLSEQLYDIFKNEIDIFVSSSSTHGIDAGENFHYVLKQQLSEANFGILILTQYNSKSEWLMFEAGALSKSKFSHVIPFLFNRKATNREDPLQGLNYLIYSKEGFLELIEYIEKTILKFKYPDFEQDRLSTLAKEKSKKSISTWLSFEKKISNLLDNYVETVDGISDDASNLMNNPDAYDKILSKREDHLSELIAKIDEDKTLKRVIIFGGVSTILRNEKTIKTFARWLLRDHKPKLFICYESKDALLDRARYLNESIMEIDDTERIKKVDKKVQQIRDMRNLLVENTANSVKDSLFFVKIPNMLGSFITIEGVTMYLTPALDKRSSDTFTFKLKKSRLNEQLLDFIVNQLSGNVNYSTPKVKTAF